MTFPSPQAAAYATLPETLAIRLETPFDDTWIEGLHEIAFGPGRFARAAYRVRERFPVDPSLCFVAELSGHHAASVRMTPVGVGAHNGYLLGPLMTVPEYRKQGAGRALVRHVSDLALARDGVDFVMLVGDLSYYGPLGFKPTTPHAIIMPGPVDPARVLVHPHDPDLAPALKGRIGRFRP